MWNIEKMAAAVALSAPQSATIKVQVINITNSVSNFYSFLLLTPALSLCSITLSLIHITAAQAFSNGLPDLA